MDQVPHTTITGAIKANAAVSIAGITMNGNAIEDVKKDAKGGKNGLSSEDYGLRVPEFGRRGGKGKSAALEERPGGLEERFAC